MKYKKYQDTETWEILMRALKELSKNQDIEITTSEDYVIGYLCEKLLTTTMKNQNQTFDIHG